MRMRQVEHVAFVGVGGMLEELWLGNLNEEDHIEDIGIQRRIMLKWIFKQQNGRRKFNE
jgi:hypothetical protein